MAKKRLWSQDEIKELHRLKDLGLPLSEIAVRIDRSCKSLEHKLYGKPILIVTPRNKDLTEKDVAWDKDKRRTLVWGFEQRTKFRFVKQSRSKINCRYNLRRIGYIECPDDHNLYYYPSEEMRRPKIEENATKHGIKFRLAV